MSVHLSEQVGLCSDKSHLYQPVPRLSKCPQRQKQSLISTHLGRVLSALEFSSIRLLSIHSFSVSLKRDMILLVYPFFL